jgi:hypothetical protein
MFDPIDDNRVRYRPGDPRGHVESYFLKLNDPRAPRALWLKFTIFSPKAQPGEAAAELWAIAFDGEKRHAAAKQTWRFSDSEARLSRYPLTLGESSLAPGYTRGAVEKAGHRIEWDLSFAALSPPMHLFSHEVMYSLPLPRSKTLTPYPDARFSGSYRVDGEEIRVDGWSGTQGHNWGRDHTYQYAWGHSNLLSLGGRPLSDTYFEGLTARVKLGAKVTPPLSIGWLRLRGVDLPFTGLAEAARAATSIEIGAR